MSSTSFRAGGSPVPALATVATDQETIFGSGSEQDPLRAGVGGGGPWNAKTASAFVEPLPRLAPAAVVAGGGPTVHKCNANGGDRCAGLAVVPVNQNDGGKIQSTGTVEGTTAEWDNVTGDSGGLTPGHTYSVNPSTPGKLFFGVFSPGDADVVVGIALTPTVLLLQLGQISITP